MAKIVLTTLNARYIHTSLGLRYLYANLGSLQQYAEIQEYIITQRPVDIAEKILDSSPEIVAFGVYIWNVDLVGQVIAIIRAVASHVRIIVGGPEVSYEQDSLAFFEDVDCIISGQADLVFRQVCEKILRGELLKEKIIHSPSFKLKELEYPYRYYQAEDIANRIIYVEASRGCPFKCEFCLSALDKTAWPFDLDGFLHEMNQLYERGVRHFKFVDRTFNLKVATTVRILQFFLERLDSELFLHFELIPDHLPEPLRELIQKFPQGSLQFEIGVQTFNPVVQQLISRRQDNGKTDQNIRFLREQTHAHLHVDLIIGLPGEDISSFAQGFDRLWHLSPHEIQVGILKRLKGTPVGRHTKEYQMRFNPYPPYNILSSRDIDFVTMQRLSRFARYWDMIANSGRFNHSRQLMLQQQPFQRFLQLSDWLFAETGQTHQIALSRLFALLYCGMQKALGLPADEVEGVLLQDFIASGLKGAPSFVSPRGRTTIQRARSASRQSRHRS